MVELVYSEMASVYFFTVRLSKQDILFISEGFASVGETLRLAQELSQFEGNDLRIIRVHEGKYRYFKVESPLGQFFGVSPLFDSDKELNQNAHRFKAVLDFIEEEDLSRELHIQ